MYISIYIKSVVRIIDLWLRSRFLPTNTLNNDQVITIYLLHSQIEPPFKMTKVLLTGGSGFIAGECLLLLLSLENIQLESLKRGLRLIPQQLTSLRHSSHGVTRW